MFKWIKRIKNHFIIVRNLKRRIKRMDKDINCIGLCMDQVLLVFTPNRVIENEKMVKTLEEKIKILEMEQNEICGKLAHAVDVQHQTYGIINELYQEINQLKQKKLKPKKKVSQNVKPKPYKGKKNV